MVITNKIFRKNISFIFLAAILTTACGSKTEQNTAKEDTSSIKEEVVEEQTPKQAEAKPQNIRDYYELLKPTFLSPYDSSVVPKIVKENLKNGYLQAVVGSGAMGDPVIAMALWKTADNQDIIGVFTYTGGGEGEWASLDSLKFYDAQLNEIREEVVDWNALSEKKKNFVLKHKFNKGEVSFQAEQTAIFATIPEKGTTIEIVIGVPGVLTNPFVNLVFDKQTGLFDIQDAK